MTAPDFAKLLASLNEPETVPDGFLSIDEWAEGFRVCYDEARKKLRRLHQAGLVDRKTFKVSEGGVTSSRVFYREKKT